MINNQYLWVAKRPKEYSESQEINLNSLTVESLKKVPNIAIAPNTIDKRE